MDTPKDDKQQTNDSAAPTEPGTMKLQIRTARIQKYITVDENISIKDVSCSCSFKSNLWSRKIPSAYRSCQQPD